MKHDDLKRGTTPMRAAIFLLLGLFGVVAFAACSASVTTQALPASCTVCSEGGACVDLQTSSESCGACGARCETGQVCSGGTCTSVCPEGQTACGSACVDTSTNPAHCGGCGVACVMPSAQGACSTGACTYGRCEAGFSDCDANAANGCETPVSTDIANCGGCKVACAPVHATGPVCTAGSCGYGACEPTFADCDGNKANGCEADTAIDSDHCGGCGITCTSGAVCVSGACTNLPPTVGQTSFAYPSDGFGGVSAPVAFTLTIQSVTPAVIFYTTNGATPTYTSSFAQSPLKLPIASNTIVKWITSTDATVRTHNAVIDVAAQTCFGEFLENVRFTGTDGPVIVASPGQSITAKVDYRTWRGACGYCPGCVRKPSYGVLATEGCYPNLWSSNWPGDYRTNIDVKVIAPAQPGIYKLRRSTQLDYACYTGRGVGGDDGTIIVQ